MTRLMRPDAGPIAHALRATLLLLALLASVGTASYAGPGHSGDDGHSHDAPTVKSSQSPRVIATSESYQLVGILKNGLITLYLDRDKDNAPAMTATIEVSGGGRTATAEPKPDGTYTITAESFAQPGENVLEFSIKDGETFDLLGGTLIIPAARAEHAAHGVTSWFAWISRPLPAGIAVLAGLGLLVIGALVGGLFARRTTLTTALLAVALLATMGDNPAISGPGHSGDEGHAHGPEASEGASDSPRRLPDGSVFLPKPTQRLIEVRTQYVEQQTVRRAVRLPGRVIANPHRVAIVQSIVDGRIAPVNGRFAHVGQQVRAGEVLGHIQPVMAEIDRSDVEQRAGQLDQEIALAENRVAQFKRFDTFPAERIRTAEIELENLVRRRSTLAKRSIVSEPLVAPIDGVIVSAQATIGQVVSPRDILFQVVHPQVLWVEALAHESIDTSTLGVSQAIAHAAEPAVLKFVASSPALAQHATSIRFEMTSNPARFDIGRQVTVVVETGKEFIGIVVPRAAVVQAPNGQYVVFKHVEPERFEPKPVRFVDIDGDRVLLAAGVEIGEKIAVQSASLINQIR